MAFGRVSFVTLVLGAAALESAALLGTRRRAQGRLASPDPAGTLDRRAKSLLAEVVSIQEQERRRIARDLHDRLGQRITALRLKVESLRRGRGSVYLERTVDDLLRLIDLTDRELDLLASELRPAALDDVGLVAALDSFVREWSKTYAITAEFYARNVNGRLAPDVETCLYRIVQEALNNIAKHARASRVAVVLERYTDRIGLIVEDDGCGFDPAERMRPDAAQRRIGVVGMRERAALVAGQVDVETAPGKGTTVFVRVPSRAEGTAARHVESIK